MVTLIGGGPSTILDRQLFRYHITWVFIAAPLVPDSTLSTYAVAEKLRDALPSLGLIPVSSIVALEGDPFIQFTCQVGAIGPGEHLRTLADLVEAADKLPWFGGGGSLRIMLDVSEIEIRAAGLSGVIVQAQNQAGRARAMEAAKQRDIADKAERVGAAIGEATKDALGATGDKLDEYLKKLFGGLKDLAMFALGVAGIAAIGYVIVRYRK